MAELQYNSGVRVYACVCVYVCACVCACVYVCHCGSQEAYRDVVP